MTGVLLVVTVSPTDYATVVCTSETMLSLDNTFLPSVLLSSDAVIELLTACRKQLMDSYSTLERCVDQTFACAVHIMYSATVTDMPILTIEALIEGLRVSQKLLGMYLRP